MLLTRAHTVFLIISKRVKKIQFKYSNREEKRREKGEQKENEHRRQRQSKRPFHLLALESNESNEWHLGTHAHTQNDVSEQYSIPVARRHACVFAYAKDYKLSPRTSCRAQLAGKSKYVLFFRFDFCFWFVFILRILSFTRLFFIFQFFLSINRFFLLLLLHLSTNKRSRELDW